MNPFGEEKKKEKCADCGSYASKCSGCGNYVSEFRDELSKEEYYISGMCQECQDVIFGVDLYD